LASRPDDRFAHAALRRHIQIRDRRCMAPGCRRPARHCEQDHTVDHALGGRTVCGNIGPLCKRHHLMKHEAGWRLEQPWPGVFRWTSPLGQVYDSRGEPISPPDPGARPRHLEPDDESTPPCLERPILHRPAPDPPPPPRPDRPPDDDIPPF
ncbi:MAG: HNH endonuclease signature motif containing protein, partial [Pseudonocardia sp.]